MDIDNLPFDTGSKPGMTFREVILWMAKDHPEPLADWMEKFRIQQSADKRVNLSDVLEILKEKGVIHSTTPMPLQKPTHGNCCTCQVCGYHHDDCVCTTNEILDALGKM